MGNKITKETTYTQRPPSETAKGPKYVVYFPPE